MQQRLIMKETEPRIYKAMAVAEHQIEAFDIDKRLAELIKIRVSQINGCGFCLDMHTRDAKKLGETDQRLFTVSAWREVPFFSEAEKAALELAEEVTLISRHGVSDKVYERAIHHFGETQFAQLLFIINTINCWNRIAVASHLMPAEELV